jgi:hypothetical protein
MELVVATRVSHAFDAAGGVRYLMDSIVASMQDCWSATQPAAMLLQAVMLIAQRPAGTVVAAWPDWSLNQHISELLLTIMETSLDANLSFCCCCCCCGYGLLYKN